MASQATLSRVSLGKILLATDFSPESQNAFSCASTLAKRFGSCLLLTHVLTAEDFSGEAVDWPTYSHVMQQNAEKNMLRLRNKAQEAAIANEVILRPGNACDVIMQAVAENDVDLVVLGTHGDAAVKKLFLGSTAENVIRNSRCPVLTVGPHVAFSSKDRFNHILYATDFSAGSMRAWDLALFLAQEDGSELTLLHVIECSPSDEHELQDWRTKDGDRLRSMIPSDDHLGHMPEIKIETGMPAVEILRLADTRKVDLIVMGSHAGGPMATHLPWTTLHDVLRNARSPVLTVCAK
jgi:nucleotide-binding universal stress UspA family protein